MRGRLLIGVIVLAAAIGVGVLELATATAGREGSDSNAMILADKLRSGSPPKLRKSIFAPEPAMERLLFAAQAAIGAGMVGYGCLAVRRRRSETQ